MSLSWIHTTNIYEVNLRQYTAEGTFNAFGRELDRLKDMGVQTLWFMPVTPISQKNRKGSLGSYYACSDYTSINPEFGSLSDFKNLIKNAQAKGFKIIIDWVANHTGWDHTWTINHPEYYKKDPSTYNFKTASGMDDIIELNYDEPSLRKAMIDAMKFWITECDIDGFRCDLASWVTLDFWKEAKKELDTIKPLFWLGEFDELETPQYGEVFQASYSWTWMHRTEDFYKQKLSLDVLYDILKRYDDFGDHTMRAWFTANHDENSWNGTEFEKYGDMAPALAVFSTTWNGIPLIYSGQELPNTKRLEFFEKDVIKWTGNNKMHDFYKTLLHLHSTHPALHGGDSGVQTFRIKTNHPNHVFAYLRRNESKEVLVFLNLSSEQILFTINDDRPKGVYTDVFRKSVTSFDGAPQIELGPWEYLIYEK